MKSTILNAGSLVADATKMIRPWPLALISEKYPVENAKLRLAMNVPLLESGERKILIDPGTADFLPARLYEEYDIRIPWSLEGQLEEIGLGVEDITDVLFTHLHFDHASGAFSRVPGAIQKRFPNAKYHMLKEHFDYASDPDPFEADSFSTRLFRYVDQIHWLEEERIPGIEIEVYNGHTKGLIVPSWIEVSDQEDGELEQGEGRDTKAQSGIGETRRVYFLSDLAPMEAFLQQELYCGYDLDGELARREKVEFLEKKEPGSRLILVHDMLKKAVLS